MSDQLQSGQQEYAVVDVETTGMRSTDRVIEIGIVVLDRDLEVIDEYETLIDPMRDVGETSIHGISPKMLAGAPSACSRSCLRRTATGSPR
ncbi:DNA polymerase III subunit epsilon [Thalassoglobus neptunius]|uniref:DNA polymerase III subunit epsilon n=1 Tax=Thalassoglobus neptunius TaxID=1938619 RepID=A0A5C5W837_9PLAN|nr:DNA polymerase III subunit epsilon [Thalassoglobus neptunius]